MAVRDYFETDTRFYYGVGVFIILVYGIGLAILAVLDLASIDMRVVPLTVGFFLFMLVYFISISVQRLEPETP